MYVSSSYHPPIPDSISFCNAWIKEAKRSKWTVHRFVRSFYEKREGREDSVKEEVSSDSSDDSGSDTMSA